MKGIRWIISSFALLTLLLTINGCAGPVYLNKELNRQTPEHVVYIVPSSYYGTFITTKVESEKNQKNIYMQRIPFTNWEMFDGNVNRCLRNSFKQKSVEVVMLEDEQNPAEIKTMITNDTIKNNYLQYLTLSGFDKIPEMHNGIFVVFTKFELTRIFPRIKVFTRYYIYGVQNKKLIFANKMEKTYEMTGIGLSAIGEALNNPNPADKLFDRVNGLQYDEKDSYEKICSLHIDKIVAEIIKYCLNK
jgi:hypothetical protein